MELNLIVHGRCGSSLVTAMLAETGQFNLWGTDYPIKTEPDLIRDLIRENMFSGNWDVEGIKKALAERDTSGRVLIKMPEFGFCIEKFFPLDPTVLVIRRSSFEVMRSIISVGWEDSVIASCEKYKILEKAERDYYGKGGKFKALTIRQKDFLIVAWGRLRTDYYISRYSGRKLFIYFDDIVLRKEDVYCQLDRFYGFEPEEHWELWKELSTKKQQDAARQPKKENFYKPYDIDFSDDWEVFADIIYTFNN